MKKIIIIILFIFLSLIACSKSSTIKFSSQDCKINWTLCKSYPDREFKIYKENNPIKISILDSGIDSTHPLLKGKIKKSINLIEQGQPSIDELGHGTAIAGIIAAKPNKFNVQGVSPNVELFDVKVLNAKGGGKIEDAIKGINWSIKNDVDIINLSFGFHKDDPKLKKVIKHALDENIIIVAASGNTLGLYTDYPAKYRGVISISSVDKNLNKDPFSAKGKIDFVAPGKEIPIITLDRASKLSDGTSYAAAFVSGFIANILSTKKTIISNKEIMEVLKDKSKDLGEKGFDNNFGYGFLQMN